MKRQVVIIHGGEVFEDYLDYLKFLKSIKVDPYRKPFKDWKSTLQEKLGNKYEVLQPSMPNKLNARYEEWRIMFEKYLPFIRKGSVLVGHSLGASFLAKYLSENKLEIKLGGIFLIAGAQYGVASFTPAFIPTGSNVWHSTADPVVPILDGLRPTRVFNGKGHFLQSTFPELVKEIKKIAS